MQYYPQQQPLANNYGYPQPGMYNNMPGMYPQMSTNGFAAASNQMNFQSYQQPQQYVPQGYQQQYYQQPYMPQGYQPQYIPQGYVPNQQSISLNVGGAGYNEEQPMSKTKEEMHQDMIRELAEMSSEQRAQFQMSPEIKAEVQQEIYRLASAPAEQQAAYYAQRAPQIAAENAQRMGLYSQGHANIEAQHAAMTQQGQQISYSYVPPADQALRMQQAAYNNPYAQQFMTGGLGYGGTGMNGGYYSGAYNYNPYFIASQQQAIQAQQMEQQRSTANFYKRMYKSACNITGTECTDEALAFYDPAGSVQDDLSDLTYEEQQTYYQLLKQQEEIRYGQAMVDELYAAGLPTYTHQVGYYYSQQYNKIFDDYRQQVPADIGLVEYFNGGYASKDYMNAIDAEQQRKQSKLRSLYNKNEFDQLMSFHRSSGSFSYNRNLDDQEIHLPQLISSQQRVERRARFIENILAKSQNNM